MEAYLPEIVALLVSLLEGATSSLPKGAPAEDVHVSAPLAVTGQDAAADVHVDNAPEGQSDADVDEAEEAMQVDGATEQVGQIHPPADSTLLTMILVRLSFELG